MGGALLVDFSVHSSVVGYHGLGEESTITRRTSSWICGNPVGRVPAGRARLARGLDGRRPAGISSRAGRLLVVVSTNTGY